MTDKLDGYYTIDQLCDAAIEAAQLDGDNDLGRTLGFKSNRVSHWRTGRTIPSDDAVVRVAIMAKADPRQALLNLQIWRNEEDPEVVKYWETIREVLKNAAAVILMAVVATVLYSANANAAGTYREQSAHKLCLTLSKIYIMRHLL